MFNKYQWDLYKQSSDNKIAFFERFLQGDYSGFKEGMLELNRVFSPDIDGVRDLPSDLDWFLEIREEDRKVGELEEQLESKETKDTDNQIAIIKENRLVTVYEYIDEVWRDYVDDIFEDCKSNSEFRSTMCLSVTGISLKFSGDDPEFFVPYTFAGNLIALQQIFSFLEIEFPLIPLKNDLTGRALFYAEICKSLQKFRIENDLKPTELWALIYDYAPRVCGGLSYLNRQDIEPRRAFFIGGGIRGNGDEECLRAAKNDDIFLWQGSSDGECGDVSLVYLLSPVSAISYQVRSISTTFCDPYFYHYYSMYISDIRRLPEIGIKELKRDPILSEVGLIKANMQGVNGKIIQREHYARIHELLISKGCDASILKSLPSVQITMPEVKNEKDVEDQYLLPLLKKLGYSDADITAKPTIRMGRGKDVIPDFAIDFYRERNREFASIVVEAKYSIKGTKQLEKDSGQGSSYARALGAKYMLLISKEGLWLYESKNSFSIHIWSCEWSYFESKSFDELASRIGKRR